jgi:hypothetical protein
MENGLQDKIIKGVNSLFEAEKQFLHTLTSHQSTRATILLTILDKLKTLTTKYQKSTMKLQSMICFIILKFSKIMFPLPKGFLSF